MTTGDGTPLVQDPGGIVLGLGSVGQSEELGIIRPMSDSYAAALHAAGVDLTYDSHPGNHDWNNFRDEFRAAVGWGLFKPVVDRPSEWVNDTVATHGSLWGIGYRFDAPPDRVVRFRRSGDTLEISAAGSPVSLTTVGGCVLHVATPGAVDIPKRPCARLGLRVRPGVIATGRRTRVIARVSPATAGVVVRLGTARKRTDEHGVARLKVCLSTPGGRHARASAADRLPGAALVKVRGRARRCR
jgi:hypothetical protein